MGSVILSLVLMGAEPSVIERLDSLVAKYDSVEQMGMFTCGLALRQARRDEAFAAEMMQVGPKALPVLEEALRDIWERGYEAKYGMASAPIHQAYGKLGGKKVLPKLLARLSVNGGARLYGGIADAANLDEFRWVDPKLPMYIRCGERTTTSALMELVDRWYGGQMEEFARLLGPKSEAEWRRLGLRLVTPPEDESLWMGLRVIDKANGEYEFVDRELNACGRVKLEPIQGHSGPAFEFDDLAGVVRTIEGCAARSRRPGARTDVFRVH